MNPHAPLPQLATVTLRAKHVRLSLLRSCRQSHTAPQRTPIASDEVRGLQRSHALWVGPRASLFLLHPASGPLPRGKCLGLRCLCRPTREHFPTVFRHLRLDRLLLRFRLRGLVRNFLLASVQLVHSALLLRRRRHCGEVRDRLHLRGGVDLQRKLQVLPFHQLPTDRTQELARAGDVDEALRQLSVGQPHLAVLGVGRVLGDVVRQLGEEAEEGLYLRVELLAQLALRLV
mmetsp:Transcript_21861/g.50063  ORF Transcript_21861/g.50063 Transcript_21861/m.50063 type:complete len:231 (-) Transcript_21861:160-852(-)